jgi:hypothetical protein
VSIKRFAETLRGQEGSTILLALFVILLGSSMIIVGLTLLTTTRDAIVQELNLKGQATSAAEAGITDALSWFRRQSTQPVAVFEPVYDPDQQIIDTEDESIGIVREFEISAQTGHYGRYEVMKVDPVTAATVVRDISSQRIINTEEAAPGTVWYVESKGIVYENNDDERAYNEAPNRVVRQVTLASEIQRLAIAPTANAALISDTGTVYVRSKGRIRGIDTTGIVYDRRGGGSVVMSGGTVEGGTSQAAIFPRQTDSLPALVRQVFASTTEDLQSLADIYVTTTDDLPPELPTLGIIYVDGNATFDSSNPLTGGGIVFVNGNMLIDVNSMSIFSGLIFVTGNYTQKSPSLISGTVMVMGNTDISGSLDIAEIMYDQDILDIVRQKLGQYRAARSPYHIPNRGV